MKVDQELTLEDLVTHIRVTHHVTTRNLLRSMRGRLELVAAGCLGAEFERVEALRRTFAYFRDDLLAHLLSEERVVFPYIILLEQAVEGRAPRPAAAFRSIASPVRLMKNEQEMTREALGRLEPAIDAARPRGSRDHWEALEADFAVLRTDLALHVHLEQDVVFPRAVEAEETLLERRLRDVASAGARR